MNAKIVVLILVLTSYSMAQEAASLVNRSRFIQHIANLSNMGPRGVTLPYGEPNVSKANDQAIEYLTNELQSYGYPVEYQWFILENDYGPGVPVRNVYGTKLGEDYQVYILSAHMDTVPRSPGADDDASGVALVLEVARIMRFFDTQKSIRFILFNAEETGLTGSFAYVQERFPLQETIEPLWLGVVQFDMILYDHGNFADPREVNHPTYEFDLEWAIPAGETFGEMFADAMAPYYRDVLVSQGMCCTDSVPFSLQGVPAVSIREHKRRDFSGGNNPFRHQPTDLVTAYSDFDFDFGFALVKMTANAMNTLCEGTFKDSYLWDIVQYMGTNQESADLTGNGIVDLQDFSIAQNLYQP